MDKVGLNPVPVVPKEGHVTRRVGGRLGKRGQVTRGRSWSDTGARIAGHINAGKGKERCFAKPSEGVWSS